MKSTDSSLLVYLWHHWYKLAKCWSVWIDCKKQTNRERTASHLSFNKTIACQLCRCTDLSKTLCQRSISWGKMGFKPNLEANIKLVILYVQVLCHGDCWKCSYGHSGKDLVLFADNNCSGAFPTWLLCGEACLWYDFWLNLPQKQWALHPGSEPQLSPCCKCWADDSTRQFSAGRPTDPACTLSQGTGWERGIKRNSQNTHNISISSHSLCANMNRTFFNVVSIVWLRGGVAEDQRRCSVDSEVSVCMSCSWHRKTAITMVTMSYYGLRTQVCQRWSLTGDVLVIQIYKNEIEMCILKWSVESDVEAFLKQTTKNNNCNSRVPVFGLLVKDPAVLLQE